MDKKLMLQLLNRREAQYREFKPDTADEDLAIFRDYCCGKSAVRIASDTYCGETTVYRVISRVREFLNDPNPESLLDTLRLSIAEHPPHYGDWDAKSILEMLYVTFGDHNRLESTESLKEFDQLYEKLNSLPLSCVDPVIDTVCDLCHLHERDGFTEGIKLGFRLNEELNQ